jgi:ferredoxin
MKITINQEECVECGACVDACADVFELPSGEKASIVERYRTAGPAEGEVDENLAECAQRGADACSVEAIHVV